MIGKAGQRIKQVRLDSGADVELSDNVGGTDDRIITITGTLQQIQAAQYMMQTAYDQLLFVYVTVAIVRVLASSVPSGSSLLVIEKGRDPIDDFPWFSFWEFCGI